MCPLRCGRSRRLCLVMGLRLTERHVMARGRRGVRERRIAAQWEPFARWLGNELCVYIGSEHVCATANTAQFVQVDSALKNEGL